MAFVPMATICRIRMNGCTMPRFWRLGKLRRPVQTTTAAPGNAVKPPTNPPTAPTLKPAPAPYRMAAESFGVSTPETCLIAAHAWDIAGALAAGCAAAFVARPGAVLSPLGPQPGIVGRNIAEVADALIVLARS